MGVDVDFDMEDGEDEDEETLQLKLQELQARLKLKKLQSAKAKENGINEARRRTEELRSMTSSAHSHSSGIANRRDENVRPPTQPSIQVPASPIRKQRPPQEQVSPRRVQLGIDKGLKATDVSLKRAPSFLRRRDESSQPVNSSFGSASSAAGATSDGLARPLSFSERLASARSQENLQTERQQKVRKARTKTFGIGKEEMENYKKDSIDIPEEPTNVPDFTREEVLARSHSQMGCLKRSNTTSSLGGQKGKSAVADSASFDAYSGLHLSRRFLPHTVLARHLTGKKVMSIKDLLKQVKAPDFELPDVEQDIVVLAIIAKKSEPRSHKPIAGKQGQKPEDRGKYMVMNLVDLDYEVDLFLFNSGFLRFWKLTEGTVVAILNPSVMPPPRGREDTGRFSLIINSDEDTILEIGTSRDLGYCQSKKKDGETCGSWVNKKRTNFCEFHSNEAVKKMKASRVEMNTTGFGSGRVRSRDVHDKYDKKTGKRQAPSNYDWETKSSFFVSRSMSAADLIDGKDKVVDKKEKEENLRRRLQAQEKERDIMKKLGRVGSAAGKEYMHKSGTKMLLDSGESSQQIDPAESHRATLKSFNLEKRDRSIQLGPVKRKRPDSSYGGSTSEEKNPTTALGWGSGLRDKLSRMKEGEKLRPTSDANQAPVRKKTRFVTEKGIREAGRESLGMDLSERQVTLDDDDDDEDELVIVH
jgi:minichromosome maintenance protein 10